MTEIAIKCPVCNRFLAALEDGDSGVRVACHSLSIRVERQEVTKA